MHALPAFLSSLSAFFLVTIISRLGSPSFFASYIAILVIEQLFQILHVASIVEPFSIDISLNKFRTSNSNLLLEYILLTVCLCLFLLSIVYILIEFAPFTITLFEPIASCGYFTFYFYLLTRFVLLLFRRKLLLFSEYKSLLGLDICLLLILPASTYLMLLHNSSITALLYLFSLLTLTSSFLFGLFSLVLNQRSLYFFEAFYLTWSKGRWLIVNSFFSTFSSSFITISISQLAGLDILSFIKLAGTIFRPVSLLTSSIQTKIYQGARKLSNTDNIANLSSLTSPSVPFSFLCRFSNLKYVIISLSFLIFIFIFSSPISRFLSPDNASSVLFFIRVLAFQQFILSLSQFLRSYFILNGFSSILPFSTILSLFLSVLIVFNATNFSLNLLSSLLLLVPPFSVFVVLVFLPLMVKNKLRVYS